MRRSSWWAGAVAVVVLAAGCGAESGIDSNTASRLDAWASSLRNAATNGDRAGAETALAGLRNEVEWSLATDQLDADQAREISGAADDVAANLAVLPAPTTTTTTTTTTTVPEPSDDGDDRKGKKKGHPHDDDDEDD